MSAAETSEQVEPQVRRPLRLAELWLLFLAVAAGVGAFAMVGLSIEDALPAHFWFESLALVVLALAAHIVVRIRAPFAAQTILPAVVLLNGVGLAMILRIQESGARGAAGADVVRNTQWSALGVVLACLVLWFLKDHRSLRKLTYTAMFASLVLLALPLVPGIGRSINGAQIWIHVAGFSLQPAEFAKITLTIFFAGYLVTNRDTLALAGPKVLGLQLPRVRDLGPILVVWVASLGVLVFQSDLGMSLLLFGIFVAMLYLATERFSWVLIGLLLFAGGAVLAWQTFSHVAQRMTGWLNAFDPAVFNAVGGSGQLVSGLFGMANGGLFGAGWGQGFPYLVPFSFSDFIYTSLAEELGLTGMLAILLVYLIFVERGLRTAITVRDGFGKLLAGGLAFTIALQVFVVVGGVTRLIPLTGLTLPFMAQGGSSLLSNWIIVAILLRISDSARRPSALPVRGQVGPGRITAADGEHDAGGAPGTTPTQIVRPVPGPSTTETSLGGEA
ncbi:FtsW/RodA/SpoVE family cell cycle protein [Xylanimonas ulmi]|uniref:Cell elongation-specific peptidoglycan biosynthesis regulator RodA n=1 Tax=Xylanimonas ulmi TaxID=228973 RepID=A0A4Q7M6G8_9MICO|nr:FtsW/RodA/SpoVE family cell cycle protein [Xylanibacterium ulmi]RZS62673.1 cell elongation-specific peptidoglycan biosynthesis regulator RodA [Xylanibacterium ulmi]